MAWVGTGVVWTLAGGTLVSRLLSGDATAPGRHAPAEGFSFVQISDSHIGFHGDASNRVTATFEEAARRVNALAQRPAFVVHTGDHVHLGRADEFDTTRQIMGTIKTGHV